MIFSLIAARKHLSIEKVLIEMDEFHVMGCCLVKMRLFYTIFEFLLK